MNYIETAFYQRLLATLSARDAEILDSLGSGVPMEEYPRLVGYLHGLREAKALAENLKDEMAKE